MPKITKSNFPYARPTVRKETVEDDFSDNDFKTYTRVDPSNGNIMTIFDFPLVGLEKEVEIPNWDSEIKNKPNILIDITNTRTNTYGYDPYKSVDVFHTHHNGISKVSHFKPTEILEKGLDDKHKNMSYVRKETESPSPFDGYPIKLKVNTDPLQG